MSGWYRLNQANGRLYRGWISRLRTECFSVALLADKQTIAHRVDKPDAVYGSFTLINRELTCCRLVE